MELPRRIVIGQKNMGELGRFLSGLGGSRKVSLITGVHVKGIVRHRVEASLEEAGIRYDWYEAPINERGPISELEQEMSGTAGDAIVGIGGGRAVDIAKIVAFDLKRSFVSVPTAGSHDGISSPFVSIKGDKPHSMVASAPYGVFVDIDVIEEAPPGLLASGCGDLLANITAVRDWKLGHDATGEYYGRYSANLALMSADMIMENSESFSDGNVDARIVVEALISAGVAACIAGSSRPCSGSEHLFSHALDMIAPGCGLHGEKCGIGTIMMASMHGVDWSAIARALGNVGAPTTAEQIGVDAEQIVQALTMAQQLRPERYTILAEKGISKSDAIRLAQDTGII